MSRKALLIGINYTNSDNQLRGCYNDICAMRDYLHTRGYSIVMMSDNSDCNSSDRSSDTLLPTRDNIIAQMNLLVQNATAGDQLFMHYSGHGTSVSDSSSGSIDERDGADEAICPCDYDTAGVILDDELHQILVLGLPAGVKLRVVFDSCHSGSCLDLPYRFLHVGYYKENNNVVHANVVTISGCKDPQTSADLSYSIDSDTSKTYDNGSQEDIPGGALTQVLLPLLTQQKSWKKLVVGLQLELSKYSQIPQLCVSNEKIGDDIVDI